MVSPGEEEVEQDEKEILPGFSSIEAFTQNGFRTVVEATKFSSKLPSGHAWDLYSAYPSFQKIMDTEGNKILEMMNMILGHQGVKGNIVMRDLEEKFDLLVDFNDTILERVGSNLDELSGIRRNPEPVIVESSGSTTKVVSGSWNAGKKLTHSISLKKAPIRLLASKNIERPQIKFKDKIDNSSTPFEPKIKEKPNALKPLAILLEVSESGDSFSHPYEYELDLFKIPASQIEKVVPQKYKPVSETPLKMVKTQQDLENLMSDLKNNTEIAVDLEHHSYRTFQGITCLMQISTRDTDYIIDTLELRDKLFILNEIFTDPKVVKIFHGATSDIEWLQRDLSLYVVNMFDTHQAARMLNFVHLSLAYLLKHYCSIDVNKQFQLADWRIRPLPQELINYAREDTHYLLYVYDVMKNALLEAANGQNGHLLAVIEQSKELCKKKYEKPIFNEDSHLELYRRNKKMFDNRQMYAFRELFRWRDKTAREEDESTSYVLPNHMLISIAEVLPREMQGILALCSPIPPLVRQNVLKLHHIILKAKEQSLTRRVMEAEARLRPIAQNIWNKIDLDSPLYCPHDMKYRQDFREDLPTVLNSLGQALINYKQSDKLSNCKPNISVFEEEESKVIGKQNDPGTPKPERPLFVSPYERYKSARPFLEAQEREENMKKQKENVSQMKDKPQKLKKDIKRKEPDIPLADQPGRRKRVKNELEDTSHSSTPHQQTKQQKIEECPLPSTSSNKMPEKRQHCVEESQIPSKIMKPHKKNKHRKKQKDNVMPDDMPDQILKDDKPTQVFDVDKIDFSRFQGGSKQEISKLPKNQGKFKPKGKRSKFIGKSNHKSLTFGTKGR